MATEPRIPNDIRDLDYQDITGFVTRDDPTSHPTDTGGYADVFIGSYNKGDGERMKVAIKVFRIPLRNEKVEQYLIRETAVWSRLHHPNILRFLGLADDLGRHGVPALISPWCNNGTVMEYLKDRPLDDRFRLILGIADGVQYLHDDDVIHGNLKPSNILISHEGLPLLGGFSRSHLLNYRGFTTRPNGTCRYQAPELFEEEARYTKASDVYAFGMTCSEIWTGLPPFAGYTQDASIILQVWKGARPACSSPCSEETSLLWKLLERCWMKEPEERWPIGIVRHELGKLVETFRELEKGRDYERCYNLLLNTISRGTSIRESLSKVEGKEAEHMVNFLTKVVTEIPVLPTDKKKKRALDLLCVLVKSAQVFPKCYELVGVEFDLGSPVSQGGFGTVYKGMFDGRSVAVKVPRVFQQKDKASLSTHAQDFILWAQLSHQNIVPFYGVFQIQEATRRIAIVSPWMENGTLQDYVQKNPQVPRLPLLLDVIIGLEYLHKSNIIHTDLKPDNVLVSSSGRAMIGDFGVSNIALTVRISAIASIGTPYYTAPELLECVEGEPTPTTASDIWSFGSLCYEVLSGQVPFSDRYTTLAQLILACFRKKLELLLPSTVQIDDRVRRLIEQKCCNIDPEQRSKSEEIIAVLKGLLNIQTGTSSPADDSLLSSSPQKFNISDIEIDYIRVYDVLVRSMEGE